MRIMIVDDHIEIRNMLWDLLESHGHTVIDAVDGRQAIDRLMVYQVDLIITDVLMPGMEGVEFIMRLRQSGIPLIVISGLPRERVVNDLLLSLGVIGMVQKPFPAETLLQLVATAAKKETMTA